eukprot:TRINITY_DN3543_c0_g1_i1.p1 TRINITY_DN3543_c0_g1~~TRINITY_DN3543_c0_g1_i1.p1  ORF type:complete len:218 (+),score=58.82 TRINITY_DN3543_c0_g1_i1:130-783(+)
MNRKMNQLLILLLATSLITISTGAGVYVNLEEGTSRCFLEEVPKETLIVGKHKVETLSQVQNKGVRLIAKDPTESIVMDMDLKLPSGQFSLVTNLGGEYTFCFSSTSSSGWFGAKQSTRFWIDIQTGEAATEYDGIIEKEHISEMELRIRRLSNRLKDIRSEQNYQRGREEVFRNTSESTNARVMWWSIGQTTILILCGLWQITHLRGFFKSKYGKK